MDLSPHRVFVEELVSWRRRMGIAAGSAGDRAAAYLIGQTFLEAGPAWKKKAGAVLEQLMLERQPGVALALAASRRLLSQLEREPERFGSAEVVAYLERRHRKRMKTYELAMETAEPVAVYGVPDAALPAWFFYAQPENPAFAGMFG